MSVTLPATGLTLPDTAQGWTLSTPKHSDWKALPGGGGVTTSVRLDGKKVGTLTWDTTGAPEVTITDDATWALWLTAADDTATHPDPNLAATGHDGASLLAITLIAETSTARAYNTWSRTGTVLAPTGDTEHTHVIPTADRERAARWAAQDGRYTAWWDPEQGAWQPAPTL